MCGVVVENQLVVDFVGEDDQVVAAREFGDLLQHLPRAERSCRIVGIDQHDAAGTRRDLAFDVGQFGLPAVVFIQVVSVEPDAQLAQHRRIQRIVRAGRQNVLAGIEQRRQAEIDRLAHPGGDENIPHGGDALARGLAANGFERLGDAGRRRVSVLAVAHRFVDGFDDVRRASGNRKLSGSPTLSGRTLCPCCDDFIGDAGQVADGVADVFEAGGGGDLVSLTDRSHGTSPRRRFRAAANQKF